MGYCLSAPYRVHPRRAGAVHASEVYMMDFFGSATTPRNGWISRRTRAHPHPISRLTFLNEQGREKFSGFPTRRSARYSMAGLQFHARGSRTRLDGSARPLADPLWRKWNRSTRMPPVSAYPCRTALRSRRSSLGAMVCIVGGSSPSGGSSRSPVTGIHGGAFLFAIRRMYPGLRLFYSWPSGRRYPSILSGRA